MWGQYRLDTTMPALIDATTRDMVDPVVMADHGKGQVEMPDDTPVPCTVDMTQTPPVFTPLT